MKSGVQERCQVVDSSGVGASFVQVAVSHHSNSGPGEFPGA